MPSTRCRQKVRRVRAVVRSCIAAALLAVGCADERPQADVARADFQKRYPQATALEVQTSEDEVIARSYRIRYRVNDSGREGALEIQYMEDDETGRWIVQPEPAAILP